MIGEWEMSGLDMSGEGAFASPTPGAAMHRFTSTIKHKGTGKECKDGVDIVEWFFDKDTMLFEPVAVVPVAQC